MSHRYSVNLCPDILIRHCEGLDELRGCVEMQTTVWGYADIDVVPLTTLVMAKETGGHVLGAFDNKELVGYALGYAGLRDGKAYLHSHMVAVLPEYQDRGIGRQLKLYQRKECLRKGLGVIEWTFDPLEIKNARFNIVRLGAIVRRLLPNLYGVTSSRMHGSLPTDRLVAEWHLDSLRVKAALSGDPQPQRNVVQVSIPVNIGTLKSQDEVASRRFQDALRMELTNYFKSGYVVTGFVIDINTASYLLELGEGDPGLSTWAWRSDIR